MIQPMMGQQHKNFIGRKLNNLNGDGYHNDHMILGLSSGTLLFTAHITCIRNTSQIYNMFLIFFPLSQAL